MGYYAIDEQRLKERMKETGRNVLGELEDRGAVRRTEEGLFLSSEALESSAVQFLTEYDLFYSRQEYDLDEDLNHIPGKFLIYDLDKQAFVMQQGMTKEEVGTDLLTAAIYASDSVKKYGLDVSEEHALLIPVTEAFVNNLPVSLVDESPRTPYDDPLPMEEVTDGDFVVLTVYGFYDERYYSLTDVSDPKVRSFHLDYANLYNKEDLDRTDTNYILGPVDDIPPIVIPVSETQQARLREDPRFTEEYGFFMKPIGVQPMYDAERLKTLEKAKSEGETQEIRDQAEAEYKTLIGDVQAKGDEYRGHVMKALAYERTYNPDKLFTSQSDKSKAFEDAVEGLGEDEAVDLPWER